ncbi:ketopantoate reductase family protein [Nocardia rhizosphaerae]|uniref:Ketopantoate reductase family protein n=1 Tax=Nocardia rhizosphaerae TaxID=1691571 RepID=A0ABV8L9J8_9NOCA
MEVLIVGAGALGQVYGADLARGGAAVSYLVKPGQAERVRGGMTVERLRRWRPDAATTVEPARVYTEPAAVADTAWDSVWLLVDSTALRPDWLDTLRAAIGTTTVVTLDQSLGDLITLTRLWPSDQVVAVTVAELAWTTPLGTARPGPTAYYRPPGAAVILTGTPARVAPIRAALSRGGAPARIRRNGGGIARAARTVPYLAALEVADWSIATLRSDLSPASHAAFEAATIVAAERGLPAPPSRRTMEWTAWMAWGMFPALAPFDAPEYLRAHFTKVGAQTRAMLREWAELGEHRGLPAGHLRDLVAAMPPLPARADDPRQ